ncbi:MAG: kinase [Eubacterium sp.]|nr:kinase [Eubacterium sp.]
MAVLIMIRGNSGSGKSSTAKQLQKKIGSRMLLIPQDTVRREMLMVHDGPDNEAIGLLTALLEYGSTHCEYVVLEGILRADWYQPVFEAAAAFFAGRIFAYYYDISFEETVRRHQSKEHAAFGEAQMRSWWREKDLAGIIPEKIFGDDITSEEAVAEILRDVGIG